MSSVEFKEIDFSVIREDYSRYMLDDGTLLKAKIVVQKIFLSPIITPEGYPTETFFAAQNMATATVPQNLKRSSSQLFDPTIDKGQEIPFHEQKIKDQEYITDNGFRITIKPILTKVFKYDKYNQFGEPIYNVLMQQITNVDKMQSTAN